MCSRRLAVIDEILSRATRVATDEYPPEIPEVKEREWRTYAEN